MSLFESLVVTSGIKLNLLKLVFTFKYNVAKLTSISRLNLTTLGTTSDFKKILELTSL